MKKVALILLTVLSLNFSSCSILNTDKQTISPNEENISEEVRTEMRGVWLSFFEISDMCKGKSESEYYKNAEEVIRNICAAGLNTVFFQVRCFSDALYNSSVFPSSEYIVQNEGDPLEFDPLRIFIEIAHKYGVSVHAWVNPFRVSYSNDFSLLSEENPAKKLLNGNSSDEALFICESGIYYNPASEKVRKLILDGIRELVENYDVDGIQFDDYFYPENAELKDTNTYKSYKRGGGKFSLGDWRKENLSEFIASCYALIKSENERIVFGVSPSAKFSHNEAVYADIEKWCSEEGYIDYIMPQIYYGFENEAMPFCVVAEEWASLKLCRSVSLYCGLAIYKCGEEDLNAGKGENEWTESADIVSQQYKYISEELQYSGFALFSYSYCFGKNVNDFSAQEMGYLTSML